VKEIGIFVGENGKWSFFRDIYADLNLHYTTHVFEEKSYKTPFFAERVNRWAYNHRMNSMLQQRDLCFFEWASELLAPASHLPKKSAIITRMHAYELYVWAPKINWAHVDKVICVSQHMKQKFSELYPSHAQKAEVIYNGVALERFKPPTQRTGTLHLGMLCHIHPVKRIYEAILMVYGLKQQGYTPHLFIGGGRWPGGYFDDYYVATQRLIEKLGLQADVTLDGPVEDTPAWLQKIDLFISNSYWEGLQVALLEALAAGCYCLAHGWDGAEEVIPAANLYMTDAELQQKIIEFFNLPAVVKSERHAEMRAIACEKFDAERQKTAIRRLIEETLARNNPQPGFVKQPMLASEVEQR